MRLQIPMIILSITFVFLQNMPLAWPQNVPSVEQRKSERRIYVFMNSVPSLEVVRSIDSRIDSKYFSVLMDPQLKSQISTGAYVGLALRDFSLRPGPSIREYSKLTTPFFVTIDSRLAGAQGSAPTNRILEVSGFLEIFPKHVPRAPNVVVLQVNEPKGRFALNSNASPNPVDLDFAKKLVEPVLALYLRENPNVANSIPTLVDDHIRATIRPQNPD